MPDRYQVRHTSLVGRHQDVNRVEASVGFLPLGVAFPRYLVAQGLTRGPALLRRWHFNLKMVPAPLGGGFRLLPPSNGRYFASTRPRFLFHEFCLAQWATRTSCVSGPPARAIPSGFPGLGLLQLDDVAAAALALGHHLVGQVIFVDVAHVLNGLASDLTRRDDFDVVEPRLGL